MPASLKNLNDQQLMDHIANPIPRPDIAIHSQSVERAVKLTTEVSGLPASLQTRNWLAHAKTEARSSKKRTRTKKDFL